LTSHPRVRKRATQSGFWDTSAIIPLCCLQPQTRRARQAYRLYPTMIVWWATRVECNSALCRLERDRELSAQQAQRSLQILEQHCQHWVEVLPLDKVRSLAERLLRTHELRAADSLQLAAALVWCNYHANDRAFIGSDGRLVEAAEKEGFNVVRI
jgi:uncharacterized protein